VDAVPGFVRQYYLEMVKEKAQKRTWWLCFFMRRRVPKGKIGETCTYYMFLIQVPTERLTRRKGDRDEIESEAKTLVSDVIDKVASEDDATEEEVVDGFLVPVHNVWIVERLREQKTQLQQEVTEQAEALAEKDEALAEKDEALAKAKMDNAEQARIIADLKKQLGQD
jgi:hypothetical protein